MSTIDLYYDVFNAKKMSPLEVADSFVEPPAFRSLMTKDHCYVIGPRGSGKTTLFRMLHGESLMAWKGIKGKEAQQRIDYSCIFLPADELWASQTSPETGVAAFNTQALIAFVETTLYRTGQRDSYDNDVHFPVVLSHSGEVELAQELADAWGITVRNHSLRGLLSALDLCLLKISNDDLDGLGRVGSSDPLTLLTFSIRAFNRQAGQFNHMWALLLDEMEIAPPEIHHSVVRFVRGGSAGLILKISMSPFDRYSDSFGVGNSPIPGHDFQTVYLADLTQRDVRRITTGLWNEAVRERGLKTRSLESALGSDSRPLPKVYQHYRGRPRPLAGEIGEFVDYMQARDRTFAAWLRRRSISAADIENMSYAERSATVRKVLPLLVFRNAILEFRNGQPSGRVRKKQMEPFTGFEAVTKALEGNPRWIKSAFAQMLDAYDARAEVVGPGFQFDALTRLTNRFESLLRVLPSRAPSAISPSIVPVLVDTIADYMHSANTGDFTADPVNCFTIDRRVPEHILDALVLGLYAGAFVHVRNRRSPAVLTQFTGERFRLAYLLGVRDNREFPLRLGKDIALSQILSVSNEDSGQMQIGLNI
ncbi:ORC-CDC6 family AAA ATPase [Gordonia terrae]